MPLYLTEDEVAELLAPGDALAAVEASFARLAAGEVATAPRERLELPDGQFALMACVDRGLGFAGLKTYLWTPSTTPFLVVLLSLDTPRVEAVIEADVLGRLRTAAASAVAATKLAKDGAASLGVFGCGRQAGAHVRALREALPSLERVLVHCRDRARLEAFCVEHGCDAAGSHADVGACDVVVTATTSRDPVLRGEWLQPGALVCAIGANEPTARELDNVVLERATFVCCDWREQSQREAGDLIEPVARGALDWLEVHELQDVVAGDVSGRVDPGDIVVFKSNGIPAWDVAAAARTVELARERGVGRELA
ncbi:MAG TPA: ornithine cyclodeaminase family protein [Gaiellaceae bacterium]|nr:ornithine cyclodeaminase family protein [Gaiellaceae bacterium]